LRDYTTAFAPADVAAEMRAPRRISRWHDVPILD